LLGAFKIKGGTKKGSPRAGTKGKYTSLRSSSIKASKKRNVLTPFSPTLERSYSVLILWKGDTLSHNTSCLGKQRKKEDRSEGQGGKAASA
jgi:hypothetical protein